jgi:hypothetical protein
MGSVRIKMILNSISSTLAADCCESSHLLVHISQLLGQKLNSRKEWVILVDLYIHLIDRYACLNSLVHSNLETEKSYQNAIGSTIHSLIKSILEYDGNQGSSKAKCIGYIYAKNQMIPFLSRFICAPRNLFLIPRICEDVMDSTSMKSSIEKRLLPQILAATEVSKERIEEASQQSLRTFLIEKIFSSTEQTLQEIINTQELGMKRGRSLSLQITPQQHLSQSSFASPQLVKSFQQVVTPTLVDLISLSLEQLTREYSNSNPLYELISKVKKSFQKTNKIIAQVTTPSIPRLFPGDRLGKVIGSSRRGSGAQLDPVVFLTPMPPSTMSNRPLSSLRRKLQPTS